MDFFHVVFSFVVLVSGELKISKYYQKQPLAIMANSGANSSFWTDLCLKINDFFLPHRHSTLPK